MYSWKFCYYIILLTNAACHFPVCFIVNIRSFIPRFPCLLEKVVFKPDIILLDVRTCQTIIVDFQIGV